MNAFDRDESGRPPTGQPPDAIAIRVSTRAFAAIVVLAATAWLIARVPRFWLIVLAAIVLATAIDGPVTAMRRRGIPRPIGVLAIFALLLGLGAGALAALTPVVVSDARTLERELPAYSRQIQALATQYAPAAADVFSLTDLERNVRTNASQLALRLTALGIGFGRTAVYVFVTLVVAFFLAVDPGALARLLQRWTPPPYRPRVTRVASNIHDRIGAWARGQLLIAILFGAAMGGGLRLLGVPYAWSLGVVAGILEIVPYLGGVITLILAGFSAATLGLPHVAGVIGLYAALVGLESHVLAPILYGKALGLPPVMVLLALVAGVELLGVLGALLAIPLTVIVWAIVEEWTRDPAATPPPSAAGERAKE